MLFLRRMPLLGLVVLDPLVEECVRTIAFIIHARYFHIAATSNRMPIVFWGVGYGLFELVLRTIRHLPSLGWQHVGVLVGGLAPFSMHVLLTLIAARFALSGRAWLGLALCFGIHVANNAYAFVLVQRLFANITIPVALSVFVLHVAVMVAGSIFVYRLPPLPARAA